MTSTESTFDLFSIGHSNIPADRFVALLRDAGVNAVADVRSTPYSRVFPWFSRQPLEQRLATEGIAICLTASRWVAGRLTKASIAMAWRTMKPSRAVPNFRTGSSG
jgi:uncharacterized protein (DUF488 family)